MWFLIKHSQVSPTQAIWTIVNILGPIPLTLMYFLVTAKTWWYLFLLSWEPPPHKPRHIRGTKGLVLPAAEVFQISCNLFFFKSEKIYCEKKKSLHSQEKMFYHNDRNKVLTSQNIVLKNKFHVIGFWNLFVALGNTMINSSVPCCIWLMTLSVLYLGPYLHLNLFSSHVHWTASE